jgi:hypothetical protein
MSKNRGTFLQLPAYLENRGGAKLELIGGNVGAPSNILQGLRRLRLHSDLEKYTFRPPRLHLRRGAVKC